MQGLSTWTETEDLADVVILNVLIEDISGDPATPDRADQWITELGLAEDWIALADPDRAWVTEWGSMTGQPQWSYTVVGSDGRVTWSQRGAFADADVIIEALTAAE